MSTLNDLTNKYFKNNKRFADVVNYLVFKGEPVVKTEELYDRDSTELLALPQGGNKYFTTQKHRDVIKGWTKTGSGETLIALIGIENQSEILYAMPVRCFVYDAMNYASQVEAIARGNKEKRTAAEKTDGRAFCRLCYI